MKFASASLVCLLACASAAFAAPGAQEPPATTDASGTPAATPAPAPPPPPVYPHVTLETNKGKIVLELFTDKAPKTVENFLTYVKAGHYNNTIFHRVIPDFMIQAGGFDLDGNMKPTREPVTNEADNRVHNTRGTVAMARTADPQSAKSQFFINLKDNGFLNHTGKNPAGWGYCVFGQVVEGMETVEAIAAVAVNKPGKLSEAQPIDPVIILKAYSDVKEKKAPAAKSKASGKGKSSSKAKPKPPAPKKP